jgi:hypothetical protein
VRAELRDVADRINTTGQFPSSSSRLERRRLPMRSLGTRGAPVTDQDPGTGALSGRASVCSRQLISLIKAAICLAPSPATRRFSATPTLLSTSVALAGP